MRRQHLPQQPHPELPFQPVDRHDQPREMRKRVRAHTPGSPELTEQLTVDDPELQPELLAHLIAPLQLQRRRADHQRGPRAVAQQQLLHHQPRLDRLPEPNVVGDQQVRPRAAQCADKRLELIILDHDPAPERRLQGAMIRARHSTPPHRVQKRVQLRRFVKAIRRNRRELGPLDHRRPRLDLPHDLQLLSGRVILDGDQADQVLHRPAVE